jgi:hypothetical protein
MKKKFRFGNTIAVRATSRQTMHHKNPPPSEYSIAITRESRGDDCLGPLVTPPAYGRSAQFPAAINYVA